jgi:hypothetical protein
VTLVCGSVGNVGSNVILSIILCLCLCTNVDTSDVTTLPLRYDQQTNTHIQSINKQTHTYNRSTNKHTCTIDQPLHTVNNATHLQQTMNIECSFSFRTSHSDSNSAHHLPRYDLDDKNLDVSIYKHAPRHDKYLGTGTIIFLYDNVSNIDYLYTCSHRKSLSVWSSGLWGARLD